MLNRRDAPSANEPIAIIGTGFRFPGGANTSSKLWDLLHHPRDLLTEIPSNRFNAQGFHHKDPLYHGHSNVLHAYLLDEDPREFDAKFFGVKPVEAGAMDPQQRLLLETVYEGLDSAGLPLESLKGSDTAVYVGMMCNDYENMLLRDFQKIPTYHATGIGRSIMSNRISYFFDWHGPSMTIDTACSSSLVAVHQAVQTLRAGDARVALACGTNLLLGPENFVAESKLKMLSPDGRSRMWDSNANGYARGEGVAAIVLKTLSAALEDGDNIECLIRETGINQDGRTRGITMPSAEAQTELIRQTYAKAGLDPLDENDRCQYFEAHGTGTPAGDPIEAEAIRNAFFRTDSAQSNPLYVGSIKTVVGHTEGTAGLAGLIKASLAIQNAIIPPNRLLEKLNPNILPFYDNIEVLKSATPWPAHTVRRASVNSFGFGGANAHAILENYQSALVQTRSNTMYAPYVFSANSETSLSANLAALSSYLSDNSSPDPRDLAWTLHHRRSALTLKTWLPSMPLDRMRNGLEVKLQASKAESIGVRSTPAAKTRGHRILGVFTGQGAQYARMGAELIEQSPFAGDIIDGLEEALKSLPKADRPSWSLKEEICVPQADSKLDQAAISQPLCTAVQIMLIEILSSIGIQLAAVVGHSSGEIGAAYAAGYLSAADAIRIAYYRGLHSVLAGNNGAMLAVGTSLEDATELCESEEFVGRLAVAASNSPSSVTLSGDVDAVEEAETIFADEGKFKRKLKVDKAYHSHHMVACSEAYVASLQDLEIKIQSRQTSCEWFSSVYAETPAAELLLELKDVYWDQNMVKPVMFSQAVQKALADDAEYDLIIEIGPHPALKGPALQSLQEVREDIIPYTGLLSRGKSAIEAMSDAVGFMWAHLGPSAIDLGRYESNMSAEKQFCVVKGLPSYHWDHDRSYWHESRLSKAMRTRSSRVHELLGHPTPDSSPHHMSWRNLLRPDEIPWIRDHQLQNQTVFPAAGYLSTALEAGQMLAEGSAVELLEITDFVIHQAMAFTEEEDGIDVVFDLNDIARPSSNVIKAKFTYSAATGKDRDVLGLFASGEIQIKLGRHRADTLPMRPAPESNMIDIAGDHFYESLEEIGYGYTGPFRALTSLKRKLGKASGDVVVTPQDEPSHCLLVHPAMLDAAIQSVILAFSYPYDGQLWSLHVPTSIRKVRVNPGLCSENFHGTDLVPFDASLTFTDASGMTGDVEIYGPNSDATAVQLEGLKAVPFAPATAANDKEIFSQVIWDRGQPIGEDIALDCKATREEYDLASALERISLFYLRALDNEIAKDHPARFEGLHTGMFNFATHVITTVASGKHRHANMEWLDDKIDLIQELCNRYADSPDVKMIRTIGEQMPRVVQEDTTFVEHVVKDQILEDYYVSALGLSQLPLWLGRMAKQITHRFPRMDVLEIGAGNGGTTKAILDKIEQDFSSYTFTNVSNDLFGKAQEVFANHKEKLVFKVLDIEKDITSQGFTDASYDIIVASHVIHATDKLEQTMKNLRRLLKPGGFVLLAEVTNNDPIRSGFIFGALTGWRLGAEDGRILSPCVPLTRWDYILRKTGFSGIDTTTPDLDDFPYPGSVFCSQAITDEVEFLRQPLSPPLSILKGNPVISDLTIIGGATMKTAKLVTDLERSLRQYCSDIHRVDAIEDLIDSQLAADSTILCLAELDKPVFEDLNPRTFESLKKVFGYERNILWVTEGRRADNPFSNMIIGFGRSQLWENPDLRLQFVDLEGIARVDFRLISEALLRFQAGVSWQKNDVLSKLLWSIEPELVVKDNGNQLMPRLELFHELNERYNSARRALKRVSKTIDCRTSLVTNLDSRALVRATDGTHQVGVELPSETEWVRTLYSTNLAVKTTTGNYYLIVGSPKYNSSARCIAMTSELSSELRLETSSYWLCDVPIGRETQFLRCLVASIVASMVLSDVTSGQSLVTLDAPEELHVALIKETAKREIELIALTSQAQSTVAEAVQINAYTPLRRLRAIVGQKASKYIDLSSAMADHDVGLRIANCVPSTCQRETTSSIFKSEATPLINATSTTIQSILKLSCENIDLPSSNGGSDIGRSTISLKDAIGQATFAGSIDIIDWTSNTSIELDIQPIDTRRIFRNDRTYWLVGLSGGLGLSLCDWILRNGGKYVVISSRNPKVDPAWLQETRDAGATVQLSACDVTNEGDVKALYEEIIATLPPIAGVAQGAMVLRDTPLRDMSFENMMHVLGPKVDGSIYLDRLFHDTPLDFFIYFSSMAGVTGNIGQSNYTAANMFMCSLAAQRRKRGLNASVLNIGVIIGVGYVTREVGHADQKNLRKGGYMWLSESDFHQMFAEAILFGQQDATDEPELSTGLRHIKVNESYLPNWHNNPKFARFVIEESGTVGQEGVTKGGHSIKNRLQDARSHTDIHKIIEESVIAKLRAMLQLNGDDDAAMLSLRTDELGLDSLIAVDLRSWFLKNLQVNMPVLKILGGITVADMINDAQKGIPDTLTPNVGLGASVATSSNSKPKAQVPLKPKVEDAPPITTKAELHTKPQVESAGESRDQLVAPSILNINAKDNVFLTQNLLEKVAKPAMVEIQEIVSDSASSTSSEFEKLETLEVMRTETVTPVSSASDSGSWIEKDNKLDIARSADLSSCQSMFWFVNELMQDKTTLNHTGIFHVKGNLRVHSLELAVRELGNRHEILRTCYMQEDDHIMQVVLQTSSLALERQQIRSAKEAMEAYEKLKAHVYDLSSGRVMRIQLLSQSPSEHYFLIGCHHISVDGISHQVLMADLERLYEGKVLNSNVLQYLDYAVEQRVQSKSLSWARELDYWKREFEVIPEPLPIKFSRQPSRHTLAAYSVHDVKLRVDKELTTKIRETCRKNRVTPFHFYLAAFKVLLHHFTGAHDICLGTCDSGRHEEDMLGSIGPFINLVPLRFSFDTNQKFCDALAEAKQKSHTALANAKVPFEMLLNELRVARSSTHSPLFQAFLDYRQGAQERQQFSDIHMELMDFEPGKTAYDISLDIIDNAKGDALISLMAQKQLYTLEQAQILGNSFKNLLRVFSATPTTQVGRTRSFAPSDMSRAIEIGRGTDFQSQWPATLIHRVEEIAESFSNKTAIKHGSGLSINYKEMMLQVNSIAAALLDHGVDQGQSVAVFQEPSPVWICSMLAIMKIGAVYVPLDPSLPSERLALIVEDCQAAPILFDYNTKDRAKKLSSIGDAGLDVSTLSHADSSISLPIQASANDVALILYTSGTTGKPKGVVLKHSSFQNEVEVSAKTYGLGSDDVVLQQSSFSFDMSALQVFLALSLGGKLVTIPRSVRGDPVAITRLVALEGISYTCATPSEYVSWLHHGSVEDLRKSKWRVALSGGEAVTSSLLDKFRAFKKHDLHLFNGYGPTETTCCSTKTELNYNDPQLYVDGIPAGRPSPNESIYIMDQSRRLLPPGFSGEIVIGGIGVAAGYHSNHELTNLLFLPDINASQHYMESGWVHMYCTGDRGRLLEDGSLIVEGRMEGDTQIKLRGIRIDVQDIEQTILRSSEGRLIEAVVSIRHAGNSDSKFLVAHVVVASSAILNQQEYLASLPSQLPLPQYMRPSAILSIDRLPTLPSGKLDRKAIATLPLPQAEQAMETDDQPLTEIEVRMKALWLLTLPHDIVNTGGISRHTDFFHVGGNSMLLVEIQGQIRQDFDIRIPLIQLVESSTLGSMSSLVDQNKPSTKTEAIDWEQETEVHSAIPTVVSRQRSATSSLRNGVVVLTGATGFLGQYILKKLLSDSRVKKVHCIGVRRPSQRRNLLEHEKVVVHEGDLSQPRLGLSEDSARSIFAESDAVIHNGAEVSHLKTYRTLKQANVGSTVEIAKLCLERQIPYHYVSSGMTAMFKQREEFGEISVRDSPPPLDGLNGYPATKWVAEVLLEKVSQAHGIPVYIHRPSSVVTPGTQIGDDTLSAGLLQNLMHFSRALKAVPRMDNLRGTLDFISPEHVADIIVSDVLHSQPAEASGIVYRHCTGDLEIPIDALGEHLHRETGYVYSKVGIAEWADRAEKAGLHLAVAEAFRKLEHSGVWLPPRFVKGTQS